jgi:hypothetical protein
VADRQGANLASALVIDFHALVGDVNGDRVTNDLDLFQVWRNLLKAPGARDLNYDLNGDGQVNAADLNVVKNNYLGTLPAVPLGPFATANRDAGVTVLSPVAMSPLTSAAPAILSVSGTNSASNQADSQISNSETVIPVQPTAVAVQIAIPQSQPGRPSAAASPQLVVVSAPVFSWIWLNRLDSAEAFRSFGSRGVAVDDRSDEFGLNSDTSDRAAKHPNVQTKKRNIVWHSAPIVRPLTKGAQ